MSKQFRVGIVAVSALIASLVLLIGGVGSPVLLAQGSQESAAGEGARADVEPGNGDPAATSGERESGDDGDAVTGGLAVLEAGLMEAVELATRVPDEWEYDLDDRVIFPEDAEVDYPIRLPESEWEEILNPDAYYILRQKGTEAAFTHPLNNNKEKGIYYSRATGQPLFSSEDKFESGSGWPSYTKPINPHAIVYVEDNSLFTRRIEVVDSLSGSHLGHVFADGPQPTGQRYCINGAALIFVPEGGDPPPIRMPDGETASR